MQAECTFDSSDGGGFACLLAARLSETAARTSHALVQEVANEETASRGRTPGETTRTIFSSASSYTGGKKKLYIRTERLHILISK